MNKRYEILSAVSKNHSATIDDLANMLPSLNRRSIVDNTRCAVDDGLLERGRDDVTGMPLYSLTIAGQQRLAQGKNKQNGHATIKPMASETKQDEVLSAGSEKQEDEIKDRPGIDLSKLTDLLDEKDSLINDLKNKLSEISEKKIESDQDDQELTDFFSWVSDQSTSYEPPENLKECKLIISDLFYEAAKIIEEKDKIREDMEKMIIKLSNEIVRIDGEKSLDVYHPEHYQGTVECIDAIESALETDQFIAYCKGNVMKYVFRSGKKDDMKTDLQKAAWYLSRAINSIGD